MWWFESRNFTMKKIPFNSAPDSMSRSNIDFPWWSTNTDFCFFSPPGERWRKIVKRWWWKRQLSKKNLKHQFRLLFRLPLDHMEASHPGRKNSSIALKICKDQSADFLWKMLLSYLTGEPGAAVLPCQKWTTNERTPNFGASKDTNMKNRRYRVEMR
jgi:hypothetical protein